MPDVVDVDPNPDVGLVGVPWIETFVRPGAIPGMVPAVQELEAVTRHHRLTVSDLRVRQFDGSTTERMTHVPDRDACA